MLRLAAQLLPQLATGTHRSADPGDDYLLALAESERAVLGHGIGFGVSWTDVWMLPD
jgi:hypothetical protein